MTEIIENSEDRMGRKIYIASNLSLEQVCEKLKNTCQKTSFAKNSRNGIYFIGKCEGRKFSIRPYNNNFFKIEGIVKDKEDGCIIEIEVIYSIIYKIFFFCVIILFIYFIIICCMGSINEAAIEFLGCIIFIVFGVAAFKEQAISELLRITESHYM